MQVDWMTRIQKETAPMLYAHGPELAQHYNAAYAALLGPGHPALGEGKPLPPFLREVLGEDGKRTKTVRLDQKNRAHVVITRLPDGGFLMTFVEKVQSLGVAPFDARRRPEDDAAGDAAQTAHDLRQAEKSIEEMQRRFNRSARATDLGVWYCDLPFGDLDWSTEVKNHFWLPSDARVTIDIFYERIHRDDRDRTRASIDHSIVAHAPYDIEYRTTHPQDENRVKWVRAIGWTDYAADGTPIRFDGITLDITETKKAREELLRSNTELARFAFVASHDLKEPLRVVANYVQLLRRLYGDALDEKADEFIAHIVNGVHRMYELINDLLSYSRLGAATPQLKPVDVAQVTQLAIENLAQAIRESDATIEIDRLPTVMADVGQYVQLLQNLIGNSIKYRGTEPPHIKIFARRHGDGWVISVRDNGIGIAPEYFEKIFVLFQRLHSKDEYSGTGIGLAVCKKIVEGLDEKIWVESAPGAGTTFSFTAREVC